MTRRLLAICVLIAACKTSSEAKSEAHADLSVEKLLSEEGSVAQTVRTGPETITTTVREYGPPEEVMPPAHDRAGDDPHSAQSVAAATQGASSDERRGPLLKETVTVDQRAPATSETTLNERLALQEEGRAKLDATASFEEESAPAGLLGSLVGLWPLALLGVLGLAGLFGWWLLKSRPP